MWKLTLLILLLSFGIKTYSQDSTNRVDGNNLKQGHWIYYNDVKKLPDYRPDQKVEEGDYVDNRKNGTWVTYYSNDKVKHELTYQNNRPNGFATFYYKNGNKSEEGIWKNNKWVGEYKYYYENGQMAYDWNYNESGKREGAQKYYHENGQLMIEGEWSQGKEKGVVKEYYANGDLKSERVFNDGQINADASKSFERVNPEYKEKPKPKENIQIVDNTQKQQKAGVFDGNGFHELKDRNGNVIRKGTFADGFLVDGEVYQYDSSGKLIKTTVYKEGKVSEIKEN
jgi:antitoxin component YwqK of YwqJK toxin-antitoxin module